MDHRRCLTAKVVEHKRRFGACLAALLFCTLFALSHEAHAGSSPISSGFHRISYWKELVEFRQTPGTPESAIALLISDMHDSTRFQRKGERQSAVGAAVVISPCHALTNRHLAFDKPNLSRAQLRNVAPATRLVIVAGRGADGRPLVKRAQPIQFGEPGAEGLDNVKRDWALLELDECYKPDEIQPAALLAATKETYQALSGKLRCAAFPVDEISFDAATRGPQRLVGTTGASIIGELDGGGYLHDCGSKPGFSGMPIYTVREGRMLVIALNVGTIRNQPDYSHPMDAWDPEYANTAAPVSDLIGAIHALVLERLKLKRIQSGS